MFEALRRETHPPSCVEKVVKEFEGEIDPDEEFMMLPQPVVKSMAHEAESAETLESLTEQ